MSITVKQVQDAFDNGEFKTFSSYRERGGEDPWYIVDSWSELSYSDGHVTIDGEILEWTGVEQVGGGEGDGEYTAAIVKIGDQLFRKEGYYASHYGTEWDGDLEEVEEYEKTVKDYRRV